MPNSTTITETTATTAGYAGLTADSARNSTRDWREGSPYWKNDHDHEDAAAQDDVAVLKEPLIPRIFPVYAFI